MRFFEKVKQEVFRKENKRSILNNQEFIDHHKKSFYEIYDSLVKRLEKWGKEADQSFLNEFEYDFDKLRFHLEFIENDFRDTKEGEEYFIMERQQEEKPDSLIAAEMSEVLRGTPVSDFPLMKIHLESLEQTSISRLMKFSSVID